ncbi:integrase core domain-containing protein, partial [Pseudoduganella violaceinigra]|uniref:integrase core domain-containing protein n=1 Tax=Pseudoduganella violaceinigra TaxID=246602 RepID=UPI001B7FBC55
MTVSKSWVALTVKRHHYRIADMRRKWKRRQPGPLGRNKIWGVDLTGKVDVDGGSHAILGVIDHGSRLALCLEALPDKRSVTILGCLLRAFGRYGLPRVIRTDNESVFRSLLFRTSLRLLGIQQQFSQPGMPWQNGRIERLFGTLKEKLDRLAVEDLIGLRQAMREFGFWYNAIRPHQHLDGRTDAGRGLARSRSVSTATKSRLSFRCVGRIAKGDLAAPLVRRQPSRRRCGRTVQGLLRPGGSRCSFIEQIWKKLRHALSQIWADAFGTKRFSAKNRPDNIHPILSGRLDG